MLLRSSTFRLALVYVTLFSTSVLGLMGFIYWFTAGYMARQADATIEAEIRGLGERYDIAGLDGLSRLVAERVARQQPTGSSLYLLTDHRLRPLVGNLSRWPDVAADEEGWLNFRLEGYGPAGDDVHPARARPFLLRGGFRLLVGRDVRELEAVRRLMLRTLAWGLAVTLVLGLVGGTLMARSMMRRIETINATSRDIMSGDLSRRIPTRGSGDELDRLAGSLNAMLDRIQSLMEGVRQVSDNIAHDLRTPLARLRNRLETAALPETDPPASRAALESALAEADALLGTFNALLRIARIEARERRAAFADVDLGELIGDVGELYEPLAEQKRQTLLTDSSAAVIVGDRDLLFQALANLLDNAIKYTPAGGNIRVGLSTAGAGVELTVADDGPGIPEAFRERVLQRFFRLDPSRPSGGSGLGLSLVAAVADLHGATLRLDDMRPGLKVTLRFAAPRAA